ncbi:MAG: hypothetical protein ACI4TH_03635 [Candidatus Ornithomonoglobus sp.]
MSDIYSKLCEVMLNENTPSEWFLSLDKPTLNEWFPELARLKGIEQPPEHHREGDVWNHTMLVADKAAELRSGAKNPLGFMLSALTHDFGKYGTTAVINGRIHAYGHETAGIPFITDFLQRFTDDEEILRYVVNMCSLHMRPNALAIAKAKKKSFNKLFDLSVCPEDLLLLAKADHLGRVGPPDYSETEKLLQKALKEFYETMSRPFVQKQDLLSAGIRDNERLLELLAYSHKLRLAGAEKSAALKQTLSYAKSLYKH